MKAVDCKAVRLQIDAADAGWQPAKVIQQHLRVCQECRRFQEQESELRRLVGSLGTIPAPADFDFRLRARLANDKPAVVSGIRVSGMTFGVPSLALAALIIVLGAAFLFRGLTTPPDNPVAASAGSANHSSQIADKTSVLPAESSNSTERSTTPSDNSSSNTVAAEPKRNSQPRKPSASSQRTVSEDFSNTAAQVVEHQATSHDEVAVFPIDSSAQSLQLSLDDVNGVSRTISLPQVSFGSQRFVATESRTLIKTSSKGVW